MADDLEFQLTDPSVAKDPGSYFEMLRSECPVAHTRTLGGFCMISRYSDVHEALLNTAVFSSASGITIPVMPYPPQVCIEQDDPEHRKYRRPMQSWFTAGKMSELEPKVRQIVTECLDRIVDKGRADLAEAVAA